MKKLRFFILIVLFVSMLGGCDLFGGTTTTTTATTTTTQTTGTTTTRTTTTSTTTSSSSTTTTEESALTVQLRYIYNLAVEADAFDGTYEEWLETVRGPEGLPGEDGREVVFRVTQDYLQWQYTGDTVWSNLVNLTELKGDTGVGIQSVTINLRGELVIVYTDSTEVNLGVPIILYTVNFKDYNGYLVDTQRVAYGTAAIEPTTPPRDGYVFTGWDTDFSNVTTNLTVTALYAKESYNVVFRDEAGGLLSEQTVNYGEAAIPPTAPLKLGYTFIGWSQGFDHVMSDLVLTPRYEINVYDVTFKDYNGLIFKIEKTEHGSDATAPIVPERIGYTFTGWDMSFTNVTSNLIITATYQVNKYSITFDSNGGNVIAPINEVTHGSTVSLPRPVKTGYEFSGWFISNDEDAKRFYSTDPVTENLMLYAKWTISQEYFTVTFVSNSENGTFSEFVVENGLVNSPNVSKTGYHLEGWYTSNDGGTTLDRKWIFISDLVQANTILYAKWTINQYTISFEENGGTEVASITKNYNAAITEPVEPTKLGYTFTGWYVDEALLNEFDFTVMPAENLTLYAGWEINYYTLEYQDFDGMVISSEPIAYNTDLSLYIEPDNPIREGYEFIGWDISLPSLMPANDVILVANYKLQEFIISFEENGGTEVLDLVLEFDALVDLPDTYRLGYYFTGWYTDIDLTEEFALATMPPRDITLYAGWDLGVYLLEFQDYDGNIIYSQEIPYDFDLANFIYPIDPERVGYDFLGWDSNLPNNMPANDILLTAVYNVRQYTIIFEENGGTEVADLTLDFGGEIYLETPTKEGYVFGGWYLDQGFAEEFYLSSMPDQNLTLYAKWEVGSYSISYYETADLEIGQIFATASANFILTLDGQLYGMGLVYLQEDVDNLTVPTRLNDYFPLEDGEMIISVMGTHNYFVLTSFGRVFAVGNNGYGQLGDGTNIKRTSPVDITDNFGLLEHEFITVIESSTAGFSSAITSEGRVFTWGYNSYGNLGDGTKDHQYLPVDITGRFNFLPDEYPVLINSGSLHTVVITSANRVFSFGWGYQGQLGSNSQIMYQMEPLNITNNFDFQADDYIVSVECGQYYTLVLTAKGSVFVFGLDAYGKFGVNHAQYLNPTDIRGLIGLEEGDQVIKIAARNNSVIMLTAYGRVYGFGSNFNNMINAGVELSTVIETFDFSPNFSFDVSDIFLNELSSGYRDFSGNYYVLGRNYSGELGTGNYNAKTNLFQVEIEGMTDTLLFADVYSEGDSINLPEPTKYGYTFGGWYLDPELTIPFDLTEMPNYDITLYAAWNMSSYTIYFDSQGGTEILPLTLMPNEGVMEPTPFKEGFTFGGWYLDLEYTLLFDFNNLPNVDTTIYARWVSDEYFLSFETYEGTSISDLFYNYGDTIIMPDDPVKEGFTFAGWYLDPNFIEEFNFTTMPNEDLIIYARWVTEEFSISFETNGGQLITADYYNEGDQILLPIDLTRENYVFAGWYFDQDLTLLFDLNVMPSFSFTLYAAWEPVTVTITFDSQGGSYIGPVTLLPNEGLGEPRPTKEGFTFAGWFLESECVNEFDFNNLPSVDTTIYAKWVLAAHILSFETFGGSEISDLYYDFGDTIVFPDNPIRLGYTFAGWFSDIELTTAFTSTTMPDNSLTLYANWELEQYTVFFEENGGSLVEDLVLYYGSAISPIAESTKEGYQFIGWYLNPSLTIAFEPGLMPAEDLTLYAKWQIEGQTVDKVSIAALISGVEGETYTIQGVVVMTTEYGMILVKDDTGQVFMDNPYNFEIGDEVVLTVIRSLRNNLVYISADNFGITFVEKVASNQDLGLLPETMTLAEINALDLTDSNIYGRYIETQGFLNIIEMMYHTNYVLELGEIIVGVSPYSHSGFEKLMEYQYIEINMRAFLYQDEFGSLVLAYIGSRGELAIPEMSDEDFVDSLMTTISYYQSNRDYSAFDVFETLAYHPILGGYIEFNIDTESQPLLDEEGKFVFVATETLFNYSVTVSRNNASVTELFQNVIQPLVITEFSDLVNFSNYSEVMVKGIIVYRHNNYAYLLDAQGNLLYVDIQNLQAYAGDEVILIGDKRSVYSYTTSSYQEVYLARSEYSTDDPVVIILSSNNTYEMPVIESTIFLVNDLDYTLSETFTQYYELEGRLIVDSSGDYYLVRGQEFVEIVPVDGYSASELALYVDQEVKVRGYLSGFDLTGGYFSFRFTNLESEFEVLDLTNLEKIVIVKEVLLHQYNNQTYLETYLLEFPIAYESFTEIVISYATAGDNASLYDPETGLFADVAEFQSILIQATIQIDSDFEVVDIIINVEPESVLTISSISDMLADMGNEYTIEAVIISMIRLSDGYYLLLGDSSGQIFLHIDSSMGFYDDTYVGSVVQVTGAASLVDGRNEIVLGNEWSFTGDGETLSFSFTETSLMDLANLDLSDPTLMGLPVLVSGVLRSDNYGNFYIEGVNYQVGLLLGLNSYNYSNFVDCRILVKGFVLGVHENYDNTVVTIMTNNYAYDGSSSVVLGEYSSQEIVDFILARALNEALGYQTVFWPKDMHFMPENTSPFTGVSISYEVTFGSEYVVHYVQPSYDDYLEFLLSPVDQPIEITITVTHGSFTGSVSYILHLNGFEVMTLDDLFLVEPGTKEIALEAQLLYGSFGYCYFLIEEKVYYYEGYYGWLNEGETLYIIGKKAVVDGVADYTYDFRILQNSYSDINLVPVDTTILDLYSATDLLPFSQEYLNLSGILKYDDVINMYYLEDSNGIVYVRVDTWNYNYVYYDIDQYLLVPVEMRVFLSSELVRGEYLLVDFRGFDNELNTQTLDEATRISVSKDILDAYYQNLLIQSGDDFEFLTYLQATGVFVDYEFVDPLDSDYFNFPMSSALFVDTQTTVEVLGRLTYGTTEIATYNLTLLIDPIMATSLADVLRINDGTVLAVQGVIVALGNDWFIISDGVNNLYIESNISIFDFVPALGDEVELLGIKSSLNNFGMVPVLTNLVDVRLLTTENTLTVSAIYNTWDDIFSLDYTIPENTISYVTVSGTVTWNGSVSDPMYYLVDDIYGETYPISVIGQDLSTFNADMDSLVGDSVTITGYLLGLDDYTGEAFDWVVIYEAHQVNF